MPSDPETTPELTEVLTGGQVTLKSRELEDESGFADRMDDGTWGIASAELGDGGPYEDEHLEPLPPDIRADRLESDGFVPDDDLDPTRAAAPTDLKHLDGNFRGEGDADLSQLRNGGEETAAVSDPKGWQRDGPLTAAPTLKS